MQWRAELLGSLPNERLNFEDTIDALNRSKRILIIGCSGSGKSTLAKHLSETFDLPNYSMDRDVFWLPGWKKRDRQAQRDILKRIVAEDRWIIDGTGKSSFDVRLPRADVIVWLHLPRWQCLLSVYRRVFRFLGKVRPELAEGCPEKWPDREFLSYIWNFEKVYLPGVVAEIANSGPNIPVVWLSRRWQVNKLIDQLPQNELMTPHAEI